MFTLGKGYVRCELRVLEIVNTLIDTPDLFLHGNQTKALAHVVELLNTNALFQINGDGKLV
eukprot:213929-Rhodomonas_salina.1